MTVGTKAVRALYRAIEAGRHGEELRDHFTDDATTTEHPNAITPIGRVSDLEAILAGSTAGAGLLRHQRYDVHSLDHLEDRVVARLTWRAVVGADAGPLRAGQELTAHIAQFIRVVDGRIASIETYDCYEPLAR